MKIRLIGFGIESKETLLTKGTFSCKIQKCQNKKKNGRCNLDRIEMNKEHNKCFNYISKS